MTTHELTVAIEDALMREPLTAAELVARFEQDPGMTYYNVIAALRGMRMAGRVALIDGKLYLQRGFQL